MVKHAPWRLNLTCYTSWCGQHADRDIKPSVSHQCNVSCLWSQTQDHDILEACAALKQTAREEQGCQQASKRTCEDRQILFPRCRHGRNYTGQLNDCSRPSSAVKVCRRNASQTSCMILHWKISATVKRVSFRQASQHCMGTKAHCMHSLVASAIGEHNHKDSVSVLSEQKTSSTS